jgi:putative membrane protein
MSGNVYSSLSKLIFMITNCSKPIACIVYVLFSIACNDSGTVSSEPGDTTSVSRYGTENKGEDFVTDVLEMNAEEKAWLREAMNKASDAELKSTARQMMNEHEKMEKDLRAYADKRKFRLDDIDTSERVKLNEEPGMDWDEEWADEVGDKHRQMIRRFERAGKRIDDPELKNIIAENLPALRTHLSIVEKLEARLDRSNLNDIDPLVK